MTIQNPSDYELDTGLEDFSVSDAVIPRISIDHPNAQFKDSLSGEMFDSIQTIILGLVKQRVLWHPDLDDGDWPMCRSANFQTGFPNESDDQPKNKRFPWAQSGFDPNDFPASGDGLVRLPCSSCQLKEWGSHPDGKKPYCAEQFTLPILYRSDDSGMFVPAIISFQKTALKPLKAYLSSFARSKTAAFTAITEFTLTPVRRGTTNYAVPAFRRLGDTDQTEWSDYSISYRQMRDFLQADPGSRDEAESSSTPSDSVVDAEVVEETPQSPPPAAKKAAPQPPPPAAKKAPEPSSDDDDDDDLPF